MVTLPPPTATSPRVSSELEQARPQTSGEEELQLQLALAMSREVAEQVGARRACLQVTEMGLRVATSACLPPTAPSQGGVLCKVTFRKGFQGKLLPRDEPIRSASQKHVCRQDQVVGCVFAGAARAQPPYPGRVGTDQA